MVRDVDGVPEVAELFAEDALVDEVIFDEEDGESFSRDGAWAFKIVQSTRRLVSSAPLSGPRSAERIVAL